MRTISPSCTRGPVPSMPGHISLEADCDQLELLLNQVESLEADEARIDSEIQDLVIKKKSVHSDLLLLIKKIAKIASTLSELRLSKSPSGLRTYKRKKVGKSAESRESPADHKNEAEPVPSIVSIESLASSNCNQSVEESVASSPACQSSTSLSDGGVTMQVLHRKMLNELERPHDLGSPQDSEPVSHTHAEQNHHPSVKSDQFIFVNTENSRLDRPSGGEIVNKKDRAHKTNVCTDSEIQLNSLTDGPSREKRQRLGDSENQRVAVKEEVEAEEVLEDPLDAHLSEISKRSTVTNYFEDFVPAMSDDVYREHFRLQRRTCQSLQGILLDEPITMEFFPNAMLLTEHSQAISLEKALHITLWYLGNLASMRVVGERFGVTKSTVYVCVHRTCRLLSKLSPKFIVWPQKSDDITRIEREFHKLAGFPGVIGAIDSCHIRIVCRDKKQLKAYRNRRGYYSMLLQGVCDANKIFTNIIVGYPGSCRDAWVYANSTVGKSISENSGMVPVGKHALGDGAYPLNEGLMVPYRAVSSLTHQQANFNSKLSDTRIVIQNCFGLLKGRWRKLQRMEAGPKSVQYVPYLITACCVLHNVSQMNEDGMGEWYEANGRSSLDSLHNAENLILPHQNAATTKRDLIASQLPQRWC